MDKNKNDNLPIYKRSDMVIMPLPCGGPETFQAKHIPPYPSNLAVMKKRQTQKHNTRLAICQFELRSGSKEIQLTPTGYFRAKDGRPFEVAKGWYIDADVATKVLLKIQARRDDYVIDYEHQTIFSKDNGQPAPAAGWYRGEDVEWREGVGLVATNVRWTNKASAAIEEEEYRYISPVIIYDTKTGEVTDILMSAVTNFAALDGMANIEQLAAAHFDFSNHNHHTEEPTVNELLLAMLKALGVIDAKVKIEDVKIDDIKQDDVVATLTTLQQSQASLTALRGSLGLKDDDDIDTAVAALKANKPGEPDPAKFVSVDVVKELQTEVAALKTNQVNSEGQQIVDQAVKDGKLATPAKLDHAKLLIKSGDIATLKSFIDAEVPIAALKGGQTNGKPPAGDNEHGLTDQQMTMCKNNNIDPKDYAATLKAEEGEALATV